MADSKPAKLGRPSKLNQKIADKILELAAAGKTEKQIATAVGISLATLSNWKSSHGSFLDALKDAKEIADDLVEMSLFQRAIGFRHKEIKLHYDKYDGWQSKTFDRYYPPDTTACIFWLKNRRPDEWREAQRIEHSGKIEGGAKPQVIVTLPSNGREAKNKRAN